MRPTYDVRAWRDDGWWVAKIVGASFGADLSPLNAVSHSRTLSTVEQTARDLVATILDVGDDAFDLEVEYLLPDVVETVVCEAIGARTWLDAAHELWREHSTVAVRALTAQGFTREETAKLLGLPEQGLPEHWADQCT